MRPGTDILEAAGGSHVFQGWKHNLLTDSGGFQLVSLAKLSTMTEQGVVMQSPFHPNDPTRTITLTPEESMRIQHAIGADIMCARVQSEVSLSAETGSTGCNWTMSLRRQALYD